MTRFKWIACILAAAVLLVPVLAQGNRGKAELTVGDGKIVVDYGRPALKGRDMFSRLEAGGFWRMGMNEATVFTTPVDLTFGNTKIAKGSYSLWLYKVPGATNPDAAFELVFNSQTGQWGTQHDKSKDVAKVAVKNRPEANTAEAFTIALKEDPGGKSLVMTWGNNALSADFDVAK